MEGDPELDGRGQGVVQTGRTSPQLLQDLAQLLTAQLLLQKGPWYKRKILKGETKKYRLKF